MNRNNNTESKQLNNKCIKEISEENLKNSLKWVKIKTKYTQLVSKANAMYIGNFIDTNVYIKRKMNTLKSSSIETRNWSKNKEGNNKDSGKKNKKKSG